MWYEGGQFLVSEGHGHLLLSWIDEGLQEEWQ